MPNLKLGFALEGNSDYPVIPGLTRRLITATFPDITLDPDSTLRPRKFGHGFIRELPTFARELCDDGVAIVVAVVDTDDSRVGERRRLLDESKQRCADNQIAVCVADGLAVHSLEAWLLADQAAIFRVFDGQPASVTFHAPEKDPTPKITLNQIVRKLTQGREVTFVSNATELTEAINLELLRRRCPHFDDFARDLINCVKEWQRLH